MFHATLLRWFLCAAALAAVSGCVRADGFAGTQPTLERGGSFTDDSPRDTFSFTAVLAAASAPALTELHTRWRGSGSARGCFVPFAASQAAGAVRPSISHDRPVTTPARLTRGVAAGLLSTPPPHS